MGVPLALQVTFVPHSLGPFRLLDLWRTLNPMQVHHLKANRRRLGRVRAVLPVRVRGTDARGTFELLAHTLDLTPGGARLGSVRRELRNLEKLTILYHQRRMEFAVVWIKLVDGKSEYQVGLRAFSQEDEPWGVNLFDSCGATP